MKLSKKHNFTVFLLNPDLSVLTNKHRVKIGVVVYVLVFLLNDFTFIFDHSFDGEDDRVSVGVGNVPFDEGGTFTKAGFCNVTTHEYNR